MPIGGPTLSNEIIEFSGTGSIYQNDMSTELYYKTNGSYKFHKVLTQVINYLYLQKTIIKQIFL